MKQILLMIAVVALVGLKRWMFDNAPAVIAEHKKLVQQEGC